MTYNIAEKDILDKISEALNKLGIMFRIFSRIKNTSSLEKKINSNNKYLNGYSKIQDLLGIRIVLYFPDDIHLVHKIISKLYEENSKDSSIDELKGDIFKPIRYNIIYKLPEGNRTISHKYADFIDSTFEVQIRTVLSEGWHEVEHDLRYKFKEDWEGHSEEDRKLNGVYASLETSEWTMLQIFQSISYKHYKEKNWEAMLRHHFRMKISNFDLDPQLNRIFNSDIEIAKKFFKLDRSNLMEEMYRKKYSHPLILNNIIYFANIMFINNEEIKEITPNSFLNEFLDGNL